MCFSPEASFTSGVVLSGVAVLTVAKAARQDRSMLAFALFPAVFGLHQLIEGQVWLTAADDAGGQVWRYLYICIAFLIWPTLTPLAATLAERDAARRRIQAAILAAGVGLTIYLTYKMAVDSTHIDLAKVGHSLCYTVQPQAKKAPFWVDYIYGAVTLLPLFLSRNRRIQIFGAGVGIAYGVTFLMLHEVYFSTWCLASALLSAMIYTAIRPREASVEAVPTPAPA